MSPPILAGLDWASVAPNGRTALLSAQGEVRLFSSAGNTSDPAISPANGAIDPPAYFSWAADSRAVALYSAATRSVQWIRITDQGALADVPTPLTGIDGDVTALAGDASSGQIVIAVARSGIYQISASAGARQILSIQDASALALDAGGILWIADRTNAQLLRVSASDITAGPQVVLTDPEKLGDITAVSLSSDAKRLYLANQKTLRLYVLDPGTAALSDGIELDSSVTRFAPLGRPSLLLLAGSRERPDQPLYVLDETSGPGIFFIPAGEER